MRTGRFADTTSAGERYGVPYIHQGAHGRLIERLSPEKSRHNLQRLSPTKFQLESGPSMQLGCLQRTHLWLHVAA